MKIVPLFIQTPNQKLLAAASSSLLPDTAV